MILKTFGPNTEGRDFVIGDLHGSYSCLENLLLNLEFDPDADRMFSVGDLEDRGPESLKCLKLIEEPWFHAVKANHEQLMLDAFFDGPTGMWWERNGGSWGMSALHAKMINVVVEPADLDLIELLPKVQELPYMLTINHKSGKKFYVIHAEMPNDVEVSDEQLSDEDFVQEIATDLSYDGEQFLWGRYRFYDFYAADLSNTAKVKRTADRLRVNPGLNRGRVISGHTILQRPITLGNQTNIDTGAFASYGKSKWAGLTCINLDDWTFWQATESTFKQIEELDLDKYVIEKGEGDEDDSRS